MSIVLNVLESVCLSFVGQRGGLFWVGGVGGLPAAIKYDMSKE